MSVTITIAGRSELQSGHLIVFGTMTPDSSWLAVGETFDVSAYFSGSPKVFFGGRGGYVCNHDGGTAAAGVVLLYREDANSGDAQNARPLAAVVDAVDLHTTTFDFIAIGTKA